MRFIMTTLDNSTFGVGHLITEKDEEHGKPLGTPVSEERVTECLNADVDIVCAELDKNMGGGEDSTIQDNVSWLNIKITLGYPRLSKFKKFLAAVQEEDWETAAVEMMDSKWATQVGDRAVRLREKMLNG